jgi:hypothetical protein
MSLHREILKQERRAKRRYGRARIRNFLFTVGPSRLTGGRAKRRLLAKAIELREIEVESPRWPAAFDGLRIGHVSDFHLGELITLERAIEAVELLRSQAPDLVACTGDIVDLHHDEAAPLLSALGDVGAPMGSLLVLGNHDELHCPHTIRRLARRAGFVVLDDEAVAIRRGNRALVVGGVGWASSAGGCGRRVDRLCRDNGAVDLLLAHNPRAFDRAVERQIPLTLAGHTHGGQIALRGRPNANLALAHRRSAGLFRQGAARLFVTTGVGAWFPLRVNCPAEVAVVTMRRGGAS